MGQLSLAIRGALGVERRAVSGNVHILYMVQGILVPFSCEDQPDFALWNDTIRLSLRKRSAGPWLISCPMMSAVLCAPGPEKCLSSDILIHHSPTGRSRTTLVSWCSGYHAPFTTPLVKDKAASAPRSLCTGKAASSTLAETLQTLF